MKDAVALYVAFYNFCRPNQALGKRTPAMAAGLADHVRVCRSCKFTKVHPNAQIRAFNV
jgi:hypothetical protein